MSPNKDQLLLGEYRKILRRKAGDPVINMDEVFPERFEYFVGRYEHIVQQIGTSNIPPHKWSYIRIGFVTQGEAKMTVGMYRFTAKKNTLMVMPARVITTSQWSADSKGYLCLFNLDFFLQQSFPHKSIENKRVVQPSMQPFLHINKEQAEKVSSIFEEMLRENESDDPLKKELIALKVVELLILCERLYVGEQDEEPNRQSIDLVERFSLLLEQYFAEESAVSFYASQLHVHPNHLNAVIKAKTGISAKESIQNRKLLEAKYLLHNTNLSIKEISGKLGFSDPNYFTVFFKRLEHSSPATYRSSFI